MAIRVPLADSARINPETQLQAGEERLDVSVIDESVEGWRHLPDDAVTIEVFPTGRHEVISLA